MGREKPIQARGGGRLDLMLRATGRRTRLRDRLEIDPLVGAAYDLDDHNALIKQGLVAARRFEPCLFGLRPKEPYID
jgi:hypothetical protein